MKKEYILIYLFLASYFFTNAQVISLDSVLRIIEKNNPELKMMDAQIESMNAFANGAKSWDAPQVGTGFFMTPYNPMMWRADKQSMNNGMGSYMLSIQQMIPNHTKLKANEKYMKSMSGIEKENKNFLRNKIFTDAKMSYYETILMQKKLSVLSETEDVLKLIIKSSEIRYAYSQDKLGSIYKAKAQLEELKTMRYMFENEINQNQIMLNTLMYKNSSEQLILDTVISFKNYDVLPIDTSVFLKFRSDLRAIDLSISSKQSKQLFEQSKRLPDFGIKYDHMFSFGNQPQLFSIMGMITIPIVPWSNKMYTSSVSGIGYEIEALKQEKKSIQNELAGRLETLRRKIQLQKLQLKLYEENIIPALRKNYQANLLAYEQNTEELFMVLDAIQMLKMNQIAYYDTMQQLLLIQTEYEKEIEQE
jgi:cobalt-zinc-cadmium efflux system outer membrane protein